MFKAHNNLAFSTLQLLLLFLLSSLLPKEVATGLYAKRTNMKFDNRKCFLNPNISLDLLIHFPALQWVTLFPLKALYSHPYLRAFFSFIKTLIYRIWMNVNQHGFQESVEFCSGSLCSGRCSLKKGLSDVTLDCRGRCFGVPACGETLFDFFFHG